MGVFFEGVCAAVAVIVDSAWEYSGRSDGVIAVSGGIGSVIGVRPIYCRYPDGDIRSGDGQGGAATFFRPGSTGETGRDDSDIGTAAVWIINLAAAVGIIYRNGI